MTITSEMVKNWLDDMSDFRAEELLAHIANQEYSPEELFEDVFSYSKE